MINEIEKKTVRACLTWIDAQPKGPQQQEIKRLLQKIYDADPKRDGEYYAVLMSPEKFKKYIDQ